MKFRIPRQCTADFSLLNMALLTFVCKFATEADSLLPMLKARAMAEALSQS